MFKALPQGWLSQFLYLGGEITLRDLGNHVSGYRDYYPLDFVDRPFEVVELTPGSLQVRRIGHAAVHKESARKCGSRALHPR